MMAAAKKKAPVKKAAPKKVVAKKPAKKVAPKKSSKSSGSPSLLVKKAGYDCFLTRKYTSLVELRCLGPARPDYIHVHRMPPS
jgi:hypothetical protein